MGFTIEVLSPLHIGCGEVYTGLDYITDGQRVYYQESDVVHRFLKSESLFWRYVAWLEKQSEDLSQLEEQIRRLSRNNDSERNNNDLLQAVRRERNEKRQAFNLKRFFEENRLPLRHLMDSSVYAIPDEAAVLDSAKINKFISHRSLPFIPGSEIKGAVRTAILYDILKKEQRHYNWLKMRVEEFGEVYAPQISNVRNKRRLDRSDRNIKAKLNKKMKEITEELETLLVRAHGEKDAQYDLLKHLCVSDSYPRKPEEVLCVASSKLFIGGRERRIAIFSEYCMPPVAFPLPDLRLDFDVERRKLDSMSFSETQKSTLSNLREVFRCCHEFSADLLDHEIEFFSKNEAKDVAAHVLQDIRERNAPGSPVLRIGKDQGFLGVTIGMLIKERDPELYDSILIHATTNKSYDKSLGGPLPKSRKLVAYRERRLTAGWVRLSEATTASDGGNEQETDSRHAAPTKESMEALLKWGKR